METGIASITCSFFKAVLKFVYRILTSQSRIMKQSVEQSQNLQSEDVKYSWWRQLGELLKYGGLEENANMLTEKYLRENFNSMIARFGQKMLEKDIEDMRTDHRFQNYKDVKINVGPSEYLESDMNGDMKMFLINLRAGFPRICITGKIMNLNAVWKTWGRSKGYNFIECELCNMKEPEDALHIMLRCPQYKYFRNMYLRDLEEGGTCETVTTNSYGWKIIYSKAQDTWERLYKFWIHAIKVRGTYLNLMDEDV